MAGDYTRFRYDPLRDSTGILMQQGKVLVDQDWNEQTLLQDRRWRTETVDIIGRAVVPTETPNGFEILIAGTSLTIGQGRMYVDGLMAENHGTGPLVFNPVPGETQGTLPVPYDQQPYYPNAPALPTDTNPHLVYLDVWEREVTSLEDIDLVDKAIAVDTATRLQTVWQVKVLTDTPQGTNCSTPSSVLAATAPSAGRLTTAAAGIPASTDPCIVPMTGGYRGSGNRLYRAEIHQGGPLGTAQFKWSRDNASVASAVTGINSARDTLSVVLTKRDSVLRFQPNDWVEVTDDFRYFQGLAGEMAQIAIVNDVNLTLQLKKPLAGAFDATDTKRHTRVIRWDQSGLVRDPLGNVIVDVDTNNGLIPVPAAGTAIVLEDGIQVTFSVDTAMPVPQFRALEYWSFAARVVDASVEILAAAPPRGILHHYAWLGFVTFPGGMTNCRVFWPPAAGGESCDCTVCVSAVSHNAGTLTIQSAVNQVQGKGGGKVCLGPGVYNIDSTILISGASAIEIQGHGLPTLQATPNLASALPLMLIERSTSIAVKDLKIAAGVIPGAAAGTGLSPHPGLVLSNTFFTQVHRCFFLFGADGTPDPNGVTLSPAIGFSGAVAATDIQWNVFNNVDTGIGVSLRDTKSLALFSLSIDSNVMVCARAGVSLVSTGRGVFSEIRFTNNLVESEFGFLLEGTGLDLVVDSNIISLTPLILLKGGASSVGIACNISGARISNNQIAGDSQSPGSNGILLGSGQSVMQGTQIIGNQIRDLAGEGISVAPGAMLLQTVIAQNQLTNLVNGGIVMQIAADGSTFASAVDLDITGNILLSVAQAGDPSLLFPMVGIQTVSTVNVNISGNTIQDVGMDPTQNTARMGILAALCSGMRVAGNRVVNIGPAAPVSFSVGVYLYNTASGRIDFSGNEVRRALSPPDKPDSSTWGALLIFSADHTAVRGNLLDSFGGGVIAVVLTRASVIFTENHCLFNGNGANTVKLTGGAVIACSNFVESPSSAAGLAKGMAITSTGASAVVGNIVSGSITVNGTALLSGAHIPLSKDTLNALI